MSVFEYWLIDTLSNLALPSEKPASILPLLIRKDPCTSNFSLRWVMIFRIVEISRVKGVSSVPYLCRKRGNLVRIYLGAFGVIHRGTTLVEREWLIFTNTNYPYLCKRLPTTVYNTLRYVHLENWLQYFQIWWLFNTWRSPLDIDSKRRKNNWDWDILSLWLYAERKTCYTTGWNHRFLPALKI